MSKKILILILCTAASLYAVDKIKIKGQNDYLDVTIERDTWEGLEYTDETIGVPVKMPWSKIEDYKYGTMRSTPYERAMIFYKRNGFRQAYQEFVRCANLGAVRNTAWARSYCNYYAGMCLYELGKDLSDEANKGRILNGAITHFNKSMEIQDSHFEPDCLIMIGTVQMNLGNFDEAKTTLAKVTDKYGDAKYAQAKQLVTDAKYQSKDYAGARKDYQAILDELRDKNGPTGLELKTKIALCRFYEGDVPKARSEIGEVITKGVESKYHRKYSDEEVDPVLAFAYKAKGDMFFEAQDKDPKKALRAYLHTAVTYKQTAKKNILADASYRAGASLKEVIEKETDGDIRKQMIAKAKELLGQARALYGSDVNNQRKINKVMQGLPSR